MRHIACFTALSLAAVCGLAQQPSARPAYDGSEAPDVALQIHVDQNCRILPSVAHPFPGQKARPYHDSTLCHLESINSSEHLEELISGGQLLRSRVHIAEQTFVLQNITDDHVVFVVEYAVPKGWAIDSDPQPNRYDGTTAILPVHAGPRQIVQLHIGIRHTTALKPKIISSR